MKHNLTPTLSRLGGYLAQLERQHAPSTYTQPFREALGALERLRALQEEAQAKQKALSAIVNTVCVNYSADQATQIEAPTTPEGYI